MLVLLGSHRSLYPFATLKSSKDFFSPLSIFHDKNDTAVEIEGTQRFKQKVKENVPMGILLERYELGEHRFDSSVGFEEPWLEKGQAFVTREWLG